MKSLSLAVSRHCPDFAASDEIGLFVPQPARIKSRTVNAVAQIFVVGSATLW
jgi:hypothetical protein